MVQVPEEFCDLQVLFITLYSELYRRTVQPEKVCRTATKLVPFLQPVQECGQYPRQVRLQARDGTSRMTYQIKSAFLLFIS